jgi:protein O-mannosyl-transferase
VNRDLKARWQTAAACVVLAAATLGAYWPVFQCEFVNFDDPDYVTQNMVVRNGLTLHGLVWAFSTPHAANWHPLTWLSHMLDCQLLGLNPAGHHATNLLCHILNSLLLFLLLNKMTNALWRSALVAALFALHPLHVESVAWISERKDVLSTFFGLLAIGAYVRYAERAAGGGQKVETVMPRPPHRHLPASIFYVLSLAFFACSLMSKPMLVTLPFVLLLLDYWPLGRLRFSTLNSQLSTFVEKLPFFALSAACSLLTYVVQKNAGAVSDSAMAPFSSRLGNAVVAYLRYLGKTAWPCDLAICYPPIQWSLWQIVGAALVLLLATCAVLRARNACWVTGWFWFLLTLLPVVGLVKIGFQSMADRYSYIPLIGVFIASVWGVWDLVRGSPPGFRGAFVSLSVCVMMAFAWRTSIQTSYWQNSYRLFTHALAVHGDDGLVHTKLGEVFLERQEPAQARAHLLIALRLAPRFPDAHYQFGLLLLAEGQPGEAIAHWRNALQLRPAWPPLLNNLAWTLATCRDPACRNPAEAVRLAEQASAADRRNFSFFDTLGAAYASAGRFPDAVAAALQAVALAEAAGQTEAAAKFRIRLELYRSNQPFHEP